VLHFAVEAAFDDLLANWRAHEHRQQADTPLAELAESRRALDRARNRMHQLRLALYPEHHECESVVETVWCESLEIVVHLRWSDRHRTRPGNFACPCGHLIPIRTDLPLPR
jgi:hypothetical protein